MKKGVSPLLGAVIILGLTVLIYYIISSASVSIITSRTEASENIASGTGTVLQIEGMECNKTHLKIVLSNIGKDGISKINFLVKNSTSSAIGNKTLTLQPGKVIYAELKLSKELNGELQYIEICSPSGVCVKKTSQLPTCG